LFLKGCRLKRWARQRRLAGEKRPTYQKQKAQLVEKPTGHL
jgi:hypothetical protein